MLKLFNKEKTCCSVGFCRVIKTVRNTKMHLICPKNVKKNEVLKLVFLCMLFVYNFHQRFHLGISSKIIKKKEEIDM